MKRSDFLRSAAVLGCSALLAGCGTSSPASSAVSDLPILRIGADRFPPYTFKDADGNQTGIDVDIAKEALARIGYQPKFIAIDWELKNDLLETGAIDCIWDCFSMSTRTNTYQWAGPYMTSRQVLAVNTDSTYRSLHDLDGKVIAVQSTTLPEELLAEDNNPNYPQNCDIYSLDSCDLLYTALNKGYVDAVAVHESSISQYMDDYNAEFRILKEPLVITGLGVAFAKNDTREIIHLLDQTLTEMREDGSMETILSRYLADPKAHLEVDRIEL